MKIYFCTYTAAEIKAEGKKVSLKIVQPQVFKLDCYINAECKTTGVRWPVYVVG